MNYCSECGRKNSDVAKFCGGCGAKLTLSTKSPSSSELDKPASQWKRLANMIIDTIVSVFLIFPVGYILSFFGMSSQTIDEAENLLVYGVMIAYYFVMEYYFKKTLGKYITKTKVITTDGNTLTARQIIIRSISRLVPFDAFSFGGHNPVGWHDKWAKTIVVDDN